MEDSTAELRVLYERDGLLVVDKPSGMLVHRGWGRAPVVLVDLVRRHAGQPVVHPAHRLDRGTSGAVLFALDPALARSMAGAFERGEVRKRYLALVRGEAPEEGIIDHPLRPRRDAEPIPSYSEFRRLAISVTSQPRTMSLVEVRPRTGRLHQVRRHMVHIDHPIVNDSTHGDTRFNKRVRSHHELQRLALHAWTLGFPDPRSCESIDVTAPLPADLTEPLERMGFDPSIWCLLDSEQPAGS